MVKTNISSCSLRKRTTIAKKAAQSGPVFITTHGHPTHVLLTIEDYARLSANPIGSPQEAVAECGEITDVMRAIALAHTDAGTMKTS